MNKLYSAAAIESRVKDLAGQINKTYAGIETPIHIIIVMNGAFMFAADIVRHLNAKTILHFIGGSYFKGGIKHEISLNLESLPTDLKQAPILVIEDILDSGASFEKIQTELLKRNATHVRLATLLKRQSTQHNADFCGFTIPDELFIVGYGLDLDGQYRHLPDLYERGSTPAGALTGRC